MISDRELFLATCLTTPLLKSDAIVVLCGEDGDERAKAGVQLFGMGASDTIVLSGGVGNLSASDVWDTVVKEGVSPDRIILESESTNTREQAVNVMRMAVEKDWHYLILVASPYHAPRAYLTFLKAIQEAGKDKEIRLMNRPPSHLAWYGKPKGNDRTRAELLSGEVGKIALYSEHVASYAEGLDYLKSWEGR